jgi:hypothetical protein
MLLDVGPLTACWPLVASLGIGGGAASCGVWALILLYSQLNGP